MNTKEPNQDDADNDKTVCLKGVDVPNWTKFINVINGLDVQKLDASQMTLPDDKIKVKAFWSSFRIAIQKAKKLKNIILNECPAYVVKGIISKLHQLTIINATIKGDTDILVSEENSRNEHFNIMTLSLNNLDQLIHLTELKIKGLGAIQLTNMPSLEKLVNLRFLALTSFQLSSKSICNGLKTVTANLETLEIGDCKDLNDFPEVLKKFTALRKLRLENCYVSFYKIDEKIFNIFFCLEKLEILELINIDLSNNVIDKLQLCSALKGLVIVPLHNTLTPDTTCRLINCLKKNATTLTHLVWGTTAEFITVTNLFISNNFDEKTYNNICTPITRSKTRSGKNDNNTNNQNISVLNFKKLLQTMLKITKVEVVKTSFELATHKVFLHEYFND